MSGPGRINDSFASSIEEKLMPDDLVPNNPKPSKCRFLNCFKKSQKPPNDQSSQGIKNFEVKGTDKSSSKQNQNRRSYMVLRRQSTVKYENLEDKIILKEFRDTKATSDNATVESYMERFQSTKVENYECLVNGVLIDNKIFALTENYKREIVKLNNPSGEIHGTCNLTLKNKAEILFLCLSVFKKKNKEIISYEKLSIEKLNKDLFNYFGHEFEKSFNDIIKLYEDLLNYLESEFKNEGLDVENFADVQDIAYKNNAIMFCLTYEKINEEKKGLSSKTKNILVFKVSEKSRSYTFQNENLNDIINFGSNKNQLKNIIVPEKSKNLNQDLNFIPIEANFSLMGEFILIKSSTYLPNKTPKNILINIFREKPSSGWSYYNKISVDKSVISYMLIDHLFSLIVSTKFGLIYIHDIRINERKFCIEAHKYSITKIFYWEEIIEPEDTNPQSKVTIKHKIVSFSYDKSTKFTEIPKELYKLKVCEGFGYSMCLDNEKKVAHIRTSHSNKNIEEAMGKEEIRQDKIKTLSLKNFETIKLKEKTQASNFATYKRDSDFIIQNKQNSFVNKTFNKTFIGDNSEINTEKNSKLKPLLYVHEAGMGEFLFYDSYKYIYIIGVGEDNKSESSFDKQGSYLNYHSMVIVKNLLICAGFEMEYDIFEIINNTDNKTKKIGKRYSSIENVHGDLISVIIKHEENSLNYIISGSVNGTIILFKFDLENNSKPTQEFNSTTLKKYARLDRHSDQITALIVINKKIWSASKDLTIKIWKNIEMLSDKNQECLHSIEDNSVTFHLALHCKEYVLACTSFGKVTCYSSKTFTPVFITFIMGPILTFLSFGKKIIYSSFDKMFKQDLFIEDKPERDNENEIQNSGMNQYFNNTQNLDETLKSGKKISLIGPDGNQLYQAANYFKNLMEENFIEFNPQFDKWVILPYLLTPMHYYVQNNLPKHIEQSFFNGNYLVESTEKQTPLSMAVSKDHEDCLIPIIKSLRFKLKSNSFLLEFLGNTNIIEINFNGRKSLNLFYDLLLAKVEKSETLMTVPNGTSIPIFKTNEGEAIDYKNCLPELKNYQKDESPMIINHVKSENDGKSTEIPVNVMRSLIKITLDLGAPRSVDVLKSFNDCKNFQIFQTSFVQAYIQYKYDSTLKYMLIEFLIYFVYMASLCCAIIIDINTLEIMFFVLFSGTIISFIDLLRGIAHGWAYLKVFRNLRSSIQSVLFYYYLGNSWFKLIDDKAFENHDGINYELLLLVLFSFIKGLTFFQLFESTRYFLSLLERIMSDIIPFMTFLLYFIFVTGFILFAASGYNTPFNKSLANAYLIVTGGVSPVDSHFNIPEWFIFIFAVILMAWIMMNLLVAILNDSFSKVYNSNVIYNYRAMAWMAYEAEIAIGLLRKINFTLFRKELDNTKKYLYVCQSANLQDESDPILKRAYRAKLEIKNAIKKIKESNNEAIKLMRLNKKIVKIVQKPFKIKKSKNLENVIQESSETKEKFVIGVFNFLVRNSFTKGLRTTKDDPDLILSYLKKLN